MQCLEQLVRALAPAAPPALRAALRRARDPARLRHLLLAHHPRDAAYLAAFAGHVVVRPAELLLSIDPLPPDAVVDRGAAGSAPTGAHADHVRGTWQAVFRYRPLAGRRVLVADGAVVPALTPLTDGPLDLHDILTILGDDEHAVHLEAALVDAIGGRPDGLDLVVAAARSLVEIVEPGASGLAVGARITRARFDRLLGEIPQHTLRTLPAAALPPALAALLERDPAGLFARWCDPDVVDAWNDLVDRHDLPAFPQWPVARAAWSGVDVLAAHVDPP